MPLDAPRWKAARALFKMAEYRRDGQLFGILARRIELLRSKLDAVSPRTRRYLRRRTWRTLRRLGLDGRADLYVRMAVGVLAPFSDQDGGEPFTKRGSYSWRSRTREPDKVFDRFGRYWTFNKVLRGESAQYEPDRTERFRCANGFKPGDPEPASRVEAFSEHWDRSPEALLHLIDESHSELVHRFAVKVLRANADFTSSLDGEGLAVLILARYAATAAFGFELARQRFPLDAPDEVLAALASSDLEAARQDAWRRLDVLADRVVASTRLVAQLIRSRHADTRLRVRKLLEAHPLAEDAARVVVGRLIADLRASPPEDEALATDIVKTLGACFARELRTIDRRVVEELLTAGSTPLLVLAAEILLARQALGEAVDGATITKLIKSEHEALRSVGVRMLGNLPEDVLVENEAVLVTLATTDLADLREAVRPIARKIAAKYPVFAANLADALVKALLVRKQPEGLHEHLLRMLREDLEAILDRLPKALVQQLLRSPVSQAQELGGVLLGKNVRADELSLAEIV